MLALQDDYADRKIDVEDYHNLKNRYKQQTQIFEAEIIENKSSSLQYERILKSGISIMSNLKGFFEKGDLLTKRIILSSIFPGKLIYSQNGCRTTRINEAAKMISVMANGSTKNGTAQNRSNFGLSAQVEVTGFEPVSKHILQKLSTCLFCFELSETNWKQTTD